MPNSNEKEIWTPYGKVENFLPSVTFSKNYTKSIISIITDSIIYNNEKTA